MKNFKVYLRVNSKIDNIWIQAESLKVAIDMVSDLGYVIRVVEVA